MNIHIDTILYWYQRLLVDICEFTKCPLDAPELTYEWLLIEAPLLEKQVLAYIEGNRVETPELPEWLVPLWEQFIATNDGLFLQALRQLLLFCYKIEHKPSHEQVKTAKAEFESTDESVATWDTAWETRLPHDTTFKSARRIVSSVVYRINWQEIVPSHGPGAVFPSANPRDKSYFFTYYDGICEKYPYDQYFCGLHSFWMKVMVVRGNKGILASSDRIVAKISAVPKDSRGPRLICVHPREAIWIQQGQRILLERAITSHPLLKGKIVFTDQTVNGNLAMKSSVDREFCTLDLKEASDRISCQLVRFLFGDHTYDWMSCARASHVRMDSGRVMQLRKWAPMGNCLTFPVQSLVFWALVYAGIRSYYNKECSSIYVFGDDILFPSCYYEGAVWGLVRAGLVPNLSKTFRKGFFRESCGVDAYRGKDVTPLRLKKTNIHSAQEALSLCNLALRLRLRGFESCSAAIYRSLSVRWGRLPFSNDPASQGLVEYVRRDFGWLLCNEPNVIYDEEIHRWGVRCRLVRNRNFPVSKGYWYNLQDSLLRLRDIPEIGNGRGTEYPDPYRARLTYGWSGLLERSSS